MLMQRDDATLLVVDIQDKLLPAVLDPQGLVERAGWLISAANDLGLPVVLSEQYPSGLGHTVEALRQLCPDAPTVEKKHFSCVAEHCLPDSLLARRQVILIGMEAHVCVLQTALELKAAGKEVFVVTDCISSRAQSDLDTALLRYQQAGVWLVSREMVLFEMLRSSGHPQFRQISQQYLVPKKG
ncbi:MAG: hydrolase [Rivihabitans pingtungensis]|jgi:nicotinamidase-related amidase|uniref:hydrolase n=1 Tax=Rivihabitans pingtungensis TaxID=1054498 RepID=UPI002896DC19|nr:hydrolase [Rivihabitans pingtungensis]